MDENMDHTLKKIRLLLVDDEVEFLEATAPALERRGFQVALAQDGYAALKQLGERVFDVVILDVKMPGIDGVEVFRKIQQLCPETPVILLTGHGTIQQAFATSRDGVYEYLAKPYELEELAEVARRAAAQGLHPDRVQVLLPGGEEIRLLLVDANARLRRLLSETLGQAGMAVCAVPSGKEAQLLLAEQAFDVVLLEVRLDAQEGLALLRELKGRDPLVEVIVISDQPAVEAAVAGLKEGAFDFLIKPQKTDVLASKIRQAWERRQQRQREVLQLQAGRILVGRAD